MGVDAVVVVGFVGDVIDAASGFLKKENKFGWLFPTTGFGGMFGFNFIWELFKFELQVSVYHIWELFKFELRICVLVYFCTSVQQR